MKAQKKLFADLTAKINELDRQMAKDKMKINNTSTSKKNQTQKLEKLRLEMEALDKQLAGVDTTAIDEQKVLEAEYQVLKTKKMDLNNQLQEQQQARIEVNKHVQTKTKQLTAASSQLGRQQDGYRR